MKNIQTTLIKRLNLPDKFSLPDFFVAAGSLLLFLPFVWTMVIAFVILAISAFRGTLPEAIRKQPGAIWLYSFAGLQLFSSLLTENYMGILNSLGTFAVAMLIGLFCRSVSLDNIKVAMKSTGILSCIAAIGGIFEFIHLVFKDNGGDLLYCLTTMPESARIRLTYYNPNLYAAMLVFFIILCMYLFYDSKAKKKKTFWLAAAGLNTFVLYLTGSRMALVPLPLIIPLFLYFRKNRKPFWTSIGAEGGLLTCVALNPELIPRFGKMASVDARFDIWRGAIEAIPDHILIGGGPQYYGMIYHRMFTKKAPHAHNLLLDLLLNSGIIGTALIIMYVSRMFRLAFDPVVKKAMPLFRPLVLSMMAAVLIEGLADCNINFPAPALMMLAVMNIPVCVFSENRVPAVETARQPYLPVPGVFGTGPSLPYSLHQSVHQKSSLDYSRVQVSQVRNASSPTSNHSMRR